MGRLILNSIAAHRLSFALLALLTLALLATALWLDHIRKVRMRGVVLELLPPDHAKYDPAAWGAFFRNLFGIAAPWWKRWLWGEAWVTLEFWVGGGRTLAKCWCPERLEMVVGAQLKTALPGIELNRLDSSAEQMQGSAARSRLRLWRDELYPMGQPRDDLLRGVLGPLTASDEAVLQVVLQPDSGWQGRAMRRLDAMSGVRSSGNPLAAAVADLLDIFLGWLAHPTATNEHHKSLPGRELPPSDKVREPGYRATIRLRVAAGVASKPVMHSVVAGFRSLDGLNGLRPMRVWHKKRFDHDIGSRRPPSKRGLILTAPELAHLFHLPVPGIPLETLPLRILPERLTGSVGRVLGLAEDAHHTPVHLSQPDGRHHVHLLGATGCGKSTAMLNLALDDIVAGRGVGVVDPKGDLIAALLERIPHSERDRVVLLDPSARHLPAGLNVLDCPDPDLREVVCDSVVTIFRKNYERYWGPRTDDVLRGALLTLLHRPGLTLCEVPLLLMHPEARAQLVGSLDDPVGLEPFWAEYQRMGEIQRLQMIGPLMNKLRALLLRRTVRNILGQSRSTLDFREIMDNRRILLVSLAKGLLGEETSRLMGSFLVARIWQAALSRADIPEAEREDFNLYLDEFQVYLHLPQSLGEVLPEARGYRLNLTLANQHLSQLSRETVDALASNARTRVVFQCGQQDARYLAKEFSPVLDEEQLRNLQPFQVAVRLFSGGRTGRPFTATTRPMPPSLGPEYATGLREAALVRSGRPRGLVEEEIQQRSRDTGVTPPALPPDVGEKTSAADSIASDPSAADAAPDAAFAA